jgi:hypothetical protein
VSTIEGYYVEQVPWQPKLLRVRKVTVDRATFHVTTIIRDPLYYDKDAKRMINTENFIPSNKQTDALYTLYLQLLAKQHEDPRVYHHRIQRLCMEMKKLRIRL